MCVLVERPHHSPSEAWSLGGTDWLHYVWHPGDWSLGKSPGSSGASNDVEVCNLGMTAGCDD